MGDRTCTVKGCDKPHEARGWCPAHYQRWRATGDPLGSKIRKYKARPRCTVDECDRPNYGHGYCQLHYWRWKRYGDPMGEHEHSLKHPRLCVHCAEQYQPRRANQRFCSRRCATQFRQSDEYKELLARDLKRCPKCDEIKQRHEFYRANRNVDGVTHWCKACLSLRAAERNALPAVKNRTRENKLLARYGLTATDYKSMLNEQDYRCRICGRPHGKDGKDLVVDHCHTSGRVRGLLCGRCNTALGLFEDDAQLMTKAIFYLRGET